MTEMLHLNGWAEARPIVRRFAALAPLSRFDLDCRIADAFDHAGLRAAFRGCEVVIHAVAGDRRTILGTLATTYDSAQEAGVRRLIYLSTASVHGQTPMPGTNEDSPLNDRQCLPYNNSKVHAEWKLHKLRSRGTVEVVILRPGLVTGPRSSWIVNFAEDLLAGRAYLNNRGRGICNSIYIDNLVHAIYLSATGAGIDKHAFLVGDQETVTWSDLYRPVAGALGFDIAQVPEAILPANTATWFDRLKKIYASEHGQALLSVFPMRLKRAVVSALSSYFRQSSPLSPWTMPTAAA
jgi:nucleoside-diphosphate-sugar epimerase